jgi:hypothetical protein
MGTGECLSKLPHRASPLLGQVRRPTQGWALVTLCVVMGILRGIYFPSTYTPGGLRWIFRTAGNVADSSKLHTFSLLATCKIHNYTEFAQITTVPNSLFLENIIVLSKTYYSQNHYHPKSILAESLASSLWGYSHGSRLIWNIRVTQPWISLAYKSSSSSLPAIIRSLIAPWGGSLNPPMSQMVIPGHARAKSCVSHLN